MPVNTQHNKSGLNNGKRSEIKNTIDEGLKSMHQPEEIFAMNLAFFIHRNGKNNKYYTRSEIKTVVGFEESTDSEWRFNIFIKAFFKEVQDDPDNKFWKRKYTYTDNQKIYRLKSKDEIEQMGIDLLEKYLNFKRKDGEDFGWYMIRFICEYYRLKPFELIAEMFRQLFKHPAIYPYRKHFEALPEEEHLPELRRLINL